MRYAILFLLFAITPVFVSAQSPVVNKFYRHHKKIENVRNIKLPGWLIKFGSGIAKKHMDDPVEKEAIGLVKKIKKMRLLVAENGIALPESHITGLVADLKKKDNYESLLTVKSQGQNVHIMMREKKEMLKGLLILVDSEDGFVMLSMKTKLKLQDIVELVNSALNDELQEVEEVEVEDDEVIFPRA
ncbi:MAG: DUF4252 domain-containing protein [Bacteroidetes bacterium]|nr:DUF4252 domain-containing protein [Bacteroidota bacterium]